MSSWKNISMLNQLPKVSVVLTLMLLSGCVSAPLKKNLPPQQAVIQAYAQLYKVSSYQFSGQLKLDQIEVTPLSQSGQSMAGQLKAQDITEAQPEKTARDKTPLDQEGMTRDHKFDDMMQQIIKAYGERYRFNYQGVVDLKNKQLEFTPEFRYEARNMAGFVRAPMLADFADAKLYVDLAALSPWVVSLDSEGKYTRFDLKSYQDKVNINQLFELIRDTALANYQLAEVSAFKEAALTQQNRVAGATRKISYSMPLSHYMANLATYAMMNKSRFEQVMPKSKAAESKTEVPSEQTSLAAPVDAASVKAKIKQDPTAYQDILNKIEEKVNPSSTWSQDTWLDAKGRVVQSTWHVDLLGKETGRYRVKVSVNNQIAFSNYGSASIGYRPKPDNWIDLKSSMNGTFMDVIGKKFAKGLKAGVSKDEEKPSLETSEHIEAELKMLQTP